MILHSAFQPKRTLKKWQHNLFLFLRRPNTLFENKKVTLIELIILLYVIVEEWKKVRSIMQLYLLWEIKGDMVPTKHLISPLDFFTFMIMTSILTWFLHIHDNDISLGTHSASLVLKVYMEGVCQRHVASKFTWNYYNDIYMSSLSEWV